MTYTLGEAAKATGKSKPTISRAIKKGTITGNKNHNGEYELDPSEVHRVWPMLQLASNDTGTMKQSVTPETPNNDKALEREIELLREMLDKTEADRDQWRQQAQKVTALIEDNSQSQGLLARLFGKR